jgi:hypothetical protein
MNWFKQVVLRRRRYDDLSEQIRQHLEEKIANLIETYPIREPIAHYFNGLGIIRPACLSVNRCA